VNATGWFTMTYSGRGEKLADQAPQHPGNGILTHQYDGVGNRVLLHSWLGRQTMAYDALNRITAMWDAESPSRLTTWVYDARDLMTRQENWNGTKTTIAFDARGLFSGIRHTKSDGTVIEEPQYQRNEVGAPVLRSDTGGVLTTWVYDEAGQLRSEWRGADSEITSLTFDGAGNRLTRASQNFVFASFARATWQYDPASQIATEEGPNYFLTLSYDNNGNMRSVLDQTGVRNTWTWDARDRLLGVEVASGVEATYTYRHDNLRATVNVTEDVLKQVWDVPGFTGYGDLFEELTDGDALKRAYYRAQRLVTQKEGGENFVFVQGDLGSTAGLTDDSETERVAWKYSAWGETYSDIGTPRTPLRWNGEWGYYTAVGESTPIWVRERYLQPERGRWMSADPIGFAGGPNRYIYALNVPTWNLDPWGLVKVEVRFNPIKGWGANWASHAFIVVTDERGREWAYRAGPGVPEVERPNALAMISFSVTGRVGRFITQGKASDDFLNILGPGTARGGPGRIVGPFGRIEAECALYDRFNIDWEPQGSRASLVLLDDPREPFAPIDYELRRMINRINQAREPYNPLGPNSNSAVREMLEAIRLPLDIPPVKAPGWHSGILGPDVDLIRRWLNDRAP
jgi:RHS repeat-associated protein